MAGVVAGNYGGVPISATQAMYANTIIQVGQQRNIPARGITIALMTAKQESNMGTAGMTVAQDHDSLGLFQQRPSQGWGTPAQVMNSVYATNKFYDTLLKVPGWQAMGLSAAAQAVQRSAFPSAYAKWQPMAEAMVSGAGIITGPSSDVPVGGFPVVDAAPVDVGNLNAISDPATWKRIGFFVLGAILLFLGFMKLTGDNKLSPMTKAIGKAVIFKKVSIP
jgi:hypothetical protein